MLQSSEDAEEEVTSDCIGDKSETIPIMPSDHCRSLRIVEATQDPYGCNFRQPFGVLWQT